LRAVACRCYGGADSGQTTTDDRDGKLDCLLSAWQSSSSSAKLLPLVRRSFALGFCGDRRLGSHGNHSGNANACSRLF